MEKELETIRKWGMTYIILMSRGAMIMFFSLMGTSEIIGIISLVVSVVVISIYAFALYVICAKIKGQNIIIQQNKEIIKQLSK